MTSDWGLVRGAVALVLAAAAAPESVHADPFPTRDQNPLLMGFGLPSPKPARLSRDPHWTVAADLNWGSTALIQTDADEALIVDAETREARLMMQRALGEHAAFQLAAPYRYIGPGSLDGFIDDWHDAFGLPEGARPILPQDRLRIAYERDGAIVLDHRGDYQGLGDVALDVGLQLYADPASSMSAWLNVELPTASDELMGNDAFDASLIGAAERRLSDRWSLYGQAAVTHLGRGDVLPAQQRSIVWSALAGASVRALPSLELKLQFDAHTAVFDDSHLDYFGEAVVVTFGGAVLFDSGWRLELAVSEDVAVESAPDVVFVIAVAKKGMGTGD